MAIDRLARTVLVTGGISGIGAATCRHFKSLGHRVVAGYAGDHDLAHRFAAEAAIPVHGWDVADFAATQQAVAQIVARHGPVEILVNNAGIVRDVMLHKMTLEQWRAVIDVDLGGVFNVTRAVIGSMRERRYGRIVNISSVNGQSGQVGQTNYAAAKAGLFGFTKALALESASHGITVNAVAPGYIDTPMVAGLTTEILVKLLATVPAGRLGEADEIARAIAFLADDAAGFITGATLSINGGKYMI